MFRFLPMAFVFCLMFGFAADGQAQTGAPAPKGDIGAGVSYPASNGTTPRQEDKPSLTGLHVVGTPDHVRLVLDVSGPVEPENLLLSAPYRFVIDLPDVVHAVRDNRGNGSPGFLQTVRYGTTQDGTLRLVIETMVPFIVERHFTVEATQGTGLRIVFDLAKATEREFRIAVTRQAEQRRLAEAATAKQDIASSQIKNLDEKQVQQAPAKIRRKKRVVIDPGHGGKDGGAMTQNGVEEKNIVLAFAKRLANALATSGDYDVILTRSDDHFIPLNQRVNVAREAQADLFVSIHADSLPDDRSVRGAAIYTISEQASDSMAATISDQQNKSDLIAGHEIKNAPDAVVDILFDLTRRETSNLSIIFARHFYGKLQNKIQFFKDPLQRGAFIVLRVPDIPSALIELGFLSNPEDADLLTSDEWQEKSALEMAATIANYFEQPLIGLKE